MSDIADLSHRNTFLTLQRGLRGRCPNCGKGRMFRAFLKVADRCSRCGEDLHHHRADDAPAYFVILITGHVVVPLVLAVEVEFAPPYWVHAVLWAPLLLGLSFGLLQPIKGAIVAWQWAHFMHGFGPQDDEPNAPLPRATTNAGEVAPIAVPAGDPRR